jgi:phosphoribosyl 1,2-cyclic phosphodiesterase
MFIATLQSGSNGNCIYVEAAGSRVLFDAGISGTQAELRLRELGREIRSVDALVVSHDHRDHCHCAGVYQRKFGLPLHITRRTLQAANGVRRLGELRDVREFAAGDALCFGRLRVETFATPHDAADGVMFVVEAEGKRLGILTDLGHVFDTLRSVVGGLDALIVESNYDPGMLERGWYPERLKRRIRGPGGHLSNAEAAELVAAHAGPALRWVCLAHLSEENNTPELATKTYRKVLGRTPNLCVASRRQAVVLPEL